MSSLYQPIVHNSSLLFSTSFFCDVAGLAGRARYRLGIRCGATATLRGPVCGGYTGEVLIGATLLLAASRARLRVWVVCFQLRGLAAGVVLVQARSRGHAMQAQTVTLTPATTRTLDFRLTPVGQQLTDVNVARQTNREAAADARRTEQKVDNMPNILAARTIEFSSDVAVGNEVQLPRAYRWCATRAATGNTRLWRA